MQLSVQKSFSERQWLAAILVILWISLRSCDDDVSSNPTPKKFKHESTTYSGYIQFGFMVAGTDAEPLPHMRRSAGKW